MKGGHEQAPMGPILLAAERQERAAQALGVDPSHSLDGFAIHPVELDLPDRVVAWPYYVLEHAPALEGLNAIAKGRYRYADSIQDGLRVVSLHSQETLGTTSTTRLVASDGLTFGAVLSPDSAPQAVNQHAALNLCRMIHRWSLRPTTQPNRSALGSPVLKTLIHKRRRT